MKHGPTFLALWLPIALLSVLVLTACQPMLVANPATAPQPTEPAAETGSTTATTETSLIAVLPDPLLGGVALSHQAEAGEDRWLRPVDTVLFGNDWSTMTDNSMFQALATQQGCIEAILVKPDLGGITSLAFSLPASSAVFTPTEWSEYSVFQRVTGDGGENSGNETVVVVSQGVPIDASVAIPPAGECGSNAIWDELDRWSLASGLSIDQLDQLLFLTRQLDGSFSRNLVIVEPEGGASCSRAVTACSVCNNCGRQIVCKIVNRIRSWVC